jgi:UDP-N-acetylglucosamine:LPS N-acetylglucosamine transferase
MQRLLPQSKVLFVGTKEGMESSLAPREGLQFEAVRSGGVMGSRRWRRPRGSIGGNRSGRR